MSDIRKIQKPLIEKRRRKRINDSLETLKTLILQNTLTLRDGKIPAKLEKADILEMTVNHLKTLQENHRNKFINIEDVTSTTPTTTTPIATSTIDLEKFSNEQKMTFQDTKINQPQEIRSFVKEIERKLDNSEMNKENQNPYEKNNNIFSRNRKNILEINSSCCRKSRLEVKKQNENHCGKSHWRPWNQ